MEVALLHISINELHRKLRVTDIEEKTVGHVWWLTENVTVNGKHIETCDHYQTKAAAL